MGGKFSRVQFREQDVAVLPAFAPLARAWTLDEVALLSARLRQLSFNFCLSSDQFAELLTLRGNALFRSMLREWFAAFQNTKSSTIVNGLEFLAALALACADGKAADKARVVFDLFDFDESGAITLDELNILLKSVVRGLSKMTKGLGPRLVSLCPMAEIAELACQCFQESDLEEEQDLPRGLFVSWARRTPKIASLLRCFAQKEFVGEEEAAISIQRCVRGMRARRRAAEIRFERQLEMEQEIEQAVRLPSENRLYMIVDSFIVDVQQAETLEDVTASHKKKRDHLRQLKIEKFAHHGALYAFGSNARGQLGLPALDVGRKLAAPLLAPFFKNNELRVTSVALSAVHACAVTSNGQMFTWGAGVPGSFGFLSRKQTGKDSSSSHPRTSEGSSESMMAHVRRQPARVDDIDDVVIVDCCLGSHHSVALSETGAVYTWGSAGFGQLGHGDFTIPESGNEDDGVTGGETDAIYKKQFDQHTGREYPFVELPMQVDKSLFEEMRVLQVACGYYCTLAVCEDGGVYSWGEGSDGQLGLGYADEFQVGFLDDHIHSSSFVYMHTPTRIEALKDPIGSVSIGGNHVYAVARDHKKVFEWGAWHRRLGDAHESTFSPQENAFLGTLGVACIAAGKEHSLATCARIEFFFSLDDVRYQPHPGASGVHEDDRNREPVASCVAMCAMFGTQPANLTREISGALYCAPPLTTTSASSVANDRSLSSSSALSDAAVSDRSDATIRSNLARCVGKVVFLERGTPTGFWVSMLLRGNSTSRDGVSSLLEIPCVPSAFGPQITEPGISSRLFYTPEKLRCLRLYVRPDEIVGKVVVLEFEQSDLAMDSDDLELSDMIERIMLTLVEKVKDAQESGATAVIIVFDFLEADAFPLEVAEDDTFEFRIPTVMVRKSHHGEMLLEQLRSPSGANTSASGGKNPFVVISYKKDILGKQILAAQKFGARAIVIAQSRIEQEPVRLRTAIFADGAEKSPESTGVKIPVIMIPFEAGEKIKVSLVGLDMEDTTARIRPAGFGQLYAWGFGQNGRLGLGDIENDALFQTGFDGARQSSYQYVANPEPVAALQVKRITHIACGEEHSAAVTSDGALFCWGSGRDGKLGNGSSEDELLPVPVQSLASVRVAKVACGPRQTFAVTFNPSLSSVSRDR